MPTKVTAGKTTKTGGSDPTLDGFQPPKVQWGRSRPFWANQDQTSLAMPAGLYGPRRPIKVAGGPG